MTKTPRHVTQNAHVKDAANTAAAMNWTTSSTKPSKRCTSRTTVKMASVTSIKNGSLISTHGGTTVTSKLERKTNERHIVVIELT